MGGYFAYRGMAPFGSSSILTVDLGQQYVDFFSYLRSTLLHHPTSIFTPFLRAWAVKCGEPTPTTCLAR